MLTGTPADVLTAAQLALFLDAHVRTKGEAGIDTDAFLRWQETIQQARIADALERVALSLEAIRTILPDLSRPYPSDPQV